MLSPDDTFTISQPKKLKHGKQVTAMSKQKLGVSSLKGRLAFKFFVTLLNSYTSHVIYQ